MGPYHRYGIYYLPEANGLARFGAAWLGWDVAAGVACAHPEIDGLPRPVADLTATPRKYGFHATIKPPFHLADGCDAEALAAEFAALCARLRPARMSSLVLSNLGRFLALTPTGDTTELTALAGEAVKALDAYRAPPDEAELARRRAHALSPAQRENLTMWGYPYVMSEFRFHMTLTGALPDESERMQCEAALAPIVAPLLPAPFTVDSLCLVGSDAMARFHLITRHALHGE